MQEEFVFPLKQCIGGASVPIIKAGDCVKRGQLIATKPLEGIGANIHSSISGIVKSVTEKSIVISESGTIFDKYEQLSGKSAFELIEKSGIVGLGGAGFPTYIKLKANLSEKGMLIINAAECEPILSHNIKRIEEYPERLIKACDIICKILRVKNAVIAVKEYHTDAIKALENAINTCNTSCKAALKFLEDIYPMGEERAIIREIKGILLEPGALPTEADSVILNAETAFRIYEAVEFKKPFIDKDITVAGKLSENATTEILLDVPLGKSVENVFEIVNGIGKEYGEIIMGGPFTGKRTTLSDPITKTTGGLIATEEFLKFPDNIGLLVCACGANEERLKEIAQSMDGNIVGIEYCKQAHKTGNAYKCENPGHCPGQAGKIIALKKAGAKAVLVSNCTDCTNTVMSCAPQLGLKVFHCTDGALRSVNHKLIRKMKG